MEPVHLQIREELEELCPLDITRQPTMLCRMCSDDCGNDRPDICGRWIDAHVVPRSSASLSVLLAPISLIEIVSIRAKATQPMAPPGLIA
jgi:hypothetical protein